MASKITQASVLTSGQMKMPVVGIGTWQSTPEETDLAINAAIGAGYRHIDTAFVYLNEAAIGESLKKMFDSGKISRKELFIVTKLPCTGNRPEDVDVYIKRSLEALKLESLDLYLIHCPVGIMKRGDEPFPSDEKGNLLLDHNTDILELWKAMEAQVDAGRTKSIGLSNCNLNQIKRILDNCRIPPANLQVELHIYLQQKELVKFCKKNNVTVCAYSPLGSPGSKSFLEKRGFPGDKIRVLSQLEDPVIAEIAKKHNKLPSQVLLRYMIEYGVAVIPKSTNATRVRQNFNVFDFELTPEEFSKISALDRGEEGRMFGGRGNVGVFNLMESHHEYPFPK